MAMRSIAEGLFTDEERPRLIGGRHRATGRIVFPCPGGSDAADYESRPLSRTGTIWSYTVQRFRPKSPPYAGPATFEPFVMAYVELPGETIVASRLTDVGIDDVHIGMPVEMVLMPLDPAADPALLVHAFRPQGAGTVA